MKVCMASMAEDERFSASGCHHLNPERFLPAFVSVEIFECSDVVHFDFLRKGSCFTDLTDLGEESLFQF
jgi:hypothetical protein